MDQGCCATKSYNKNVINEMLQLGFSLLSQERWSSKRMICPLVKQPLCLEEVYSMDPWKSNLKSRSKRSSQHDALRVASNNNVGCIHVMAKLRLEYKEDLQCAKFS